MKRPDDGAGFAADEVGRPGVARVDEVVVLSDVDYGVDVEIVKGGG